MKKRHLVVLAAVMAAAFGLAGLAEAQATKIAFVNFQTFSQKSKRYTAERKKLGDLAQLKTNDLEKKKDELLNLQEELKRQGQMLNDDTRNAKIKEIGIKEMEFKLAEQQAKNLLQNEEREAMERLRGEMKKIIDAIRAEQKYTFIFDAVALLSADEALDITDQVVTAYDASHAPAKPAAAPAAGPKPAAKPAAPKPPAR
jgi:outer membrane protein